MHATIAIAALVDIHVGEYKVSPLAPLSFLSFGEFLSAMSTAHALPALGLTIGAAFLGLVFSAMWVLRWEWWGSALNIVQSIWDHQPADVHILPRVPE